MQSIKIKISKLKNNTGQIEGVKKNPRIQDDAKFQKLKKSLQDFPEMLELRELVVFPLDNDFIVVGGNMRLKALKELGEKEAVCKVLPADFTPEKINEFIIKDNVSFGLWDNTELSEWDAELLNEWGFDVPEWENAKELEAVEDNYQIPDTIHTDVVLGDLITFEKNGKELHRLMCGDSTDSDSVAKLMNGEKADMVFTSPPYNGNTSVGFHQSSKKNSLPTSPLYQNNETDNKTASEYIQFNADIFSTIKTIAKDDLVLLYNINYNRNSPDLFIDVVNKGREVFSLVETIIWEKSMAISLAGDNLTRIFEFIFVFFAGEDKPKMNKTHTNECIKNLWKISNVGANNEIHKACFPVALAEQAINVYTKDGALLFEPFTGSGSTMVAAHQLNRKCYGMELDEKYCQVIIDRMTKLDSELTVKINGLIYEKAAK